MYTESEDIKSPGNPEAKIWRYVDFAKFVSMLDSRSLYFCRLDKLEDRYESVLSAPALENVVAALRPHAYLLPEGVDVDLAARLTAASMTEIHRASIFVNCWHCNERESGAMWGVYSGQGIAIQSTVRRLQASFAGVAAPVYVGEVEYIDHDADGMVENKAFMYKNRMYSYEQEIRAFVIESPREVSVVGINEDHPQGLPIPVDLSTLIETVYVAPGRGGWFRDAVQSILAHYGLPDKQANPSAADTVPEYRRLFEEQRRELQRRGVEVPIHAVDESGQLVR